MHKPTHNHHVVFFVGPNPGFCQPDGGSIVGLHDPIRFADIDCLVVVVVLSLVLVLSSLSLFSAKQMKIFFRYRVWVGEYNENI